MKRASLAALPAGPKTESVDLTDRLLDREARVARAASDQKSAAPSASAAAKPRRRRKPAAAPSQPEPETPQLEAPPAGVPTTGEPAAITVEQALQQAEAAAQALRQAARSTPARFEVAQGYRLDALAHHIRQVADFIASLAHR